MNKVVVASREEALALIAGGMNSMLVFSPEAPHGYKKDGTPAAPRGRKPLTEERKAARAAKAVRDGRKQRAKTGPLVRTEEAPHGVKKDGTAMKKRGRPTKAVAEAKRAVAAAERAARVAARQAEKAERKAKREAAKATKAASAPIVTPPATAATEAAEVLAPLAEVVEVATREPALEGVTIGEAVRVRLRDEVCVGPVSLGMTGTVSKVDEKFARVKWDDESEDFRPIDSLEAIAS